MAYDDDNQPQGLGTPSSGAPEFVGPSDTNKTYDADPETAAAETGVQSTADNDTGAAADEQSSIDKLGKGFTGNNGFDRGNSLWGRLPNKAKAKVLGTLAGVLIGGGVGGFMVMPGLEALQLIHYSETLQSISKPQVTQSNNKISRLYRSLFSKPSSGRTRLSLLQDIGHNKLMADLSKSGITVTTESRFGLMKSMTLDPSKISDLEGKTREQVKEILKEKWNITDVEVIGNSTSKFHVSLKNMSLDAQKGIVRDMVASSGKGRLGRALMTRHLRAYYNLPDLLHPMRGVSYYAEKGVNAVLNIATKRTAKIQGKIGKLNEKFASFRAKYSGPLAAGTTALALTGIACTVVTAQSDIHNLNKANIIDPAVLAGTEASAMGDQVKYSGDNGTDGTVIDATNASLYDTHGSSALDADLFREVQGMGVSGSTTEADKAYKESHTALMSVFTADSTLNEAASVIRSMGLTEDGVCSQVGQAIQMIAGGVLMVTGTGFGAKLVVQAATTVAGGIAMSNAMNMITNQLAAKLPDLVIHQGKLGGDLDVVGKKVADNMVAANAGGAAMTHADLGTLMTEVAADDAAIARQKSVATRLFSPTDSKSVLARVIDTINPSPLRTVQNGSTALMNVATSVFSLPTKLVSASAYAATPDAPVSELPTFGDSVAVQKLDDPNENADYVAANLGPTLTNPLSSYAKRAMVCFGTRFSMTTGTASTGATVTYLDAKAVAAVDTGSGEYYDSKCSDDSDKDWVRIRAFIGDIQAMETLMCGMANYRESCTRLGYNGGPATDTSSSSPSTTQTTSTGTIANDKGWAWPISGVGRSNISRGYLAGTQKGPHKGIDLPATPGTPVLAAHNGTVSSVINGGACGLFVIVDTGTGLWAAYQHLAKKAVVKVGDPVVAGKTIVGIIGTVGSSGSDVLHTNYTGGCSSGAHLHFSIEKANRVSAYADSGAKDTSVDPLGYLP